MNDVCEIFCSDREKVERIRKKVGITGGMAQLFKALADDTRLKIIYALSLEELCVCDVAGIIGSSVSTASHHLRFLRNMGLAGYRREGKLVYYSLQDQCVRDIVSSALKHKQHGGGDADGRQASFTGGK
ncbi:MAG: metalloregulator ArsR/SmtB family transcription factor [Peptococcaceae bacterium]|nr:metalloregulator ArsR/SmtB family transcription factor [Peptococcaceae bacterium]